MLSPTFSSDNFGLEEPVVTHQDSGQRHGGSNAAATALLGRLISRYLVRWWPCSVVLLHIGRVVTGLFCKKAAQGRTLPRLLVGGEVAFLRVSEEWIRHNALRGSHLVT